MFNRNSESPQMHVGEGGGDSAAAREEGGDRSIGDIIRAVKGLGPEQMQAIIDHQASHGLRFGEAAVELGYASESDVVFALSQQFHYAYTPDGYETAHPELVCSVQPFSKQAEAFRAIRSQLTLGALNSGEGKRALAVVSPDSGDGKTFFVANLGVSLAQLGGRVLVVDADMRRPRLHKLFGVPNTGGLSSILSGRQGTDVIFQSPNIPSLYVMAVGVVPPNPLELIERPAFKLLMGELLRKFDHVLVDTAAMAFGTDAQVTAARCGAAVILARKDKTRAAELVQVEQAISRTGARLSGVIYNEF